MIKAFQENAFKTAKPKQGQNASGKKMHGI